MLIINFYLTQDGIFMYNSICASIQGHFERFIIICIFRIAGKCPGNSEEKL